MTLVEDVSRAITDAMKAKDAQRLVALRMLKAALMNREVERGRAEGVAWAAIPDFAPEWLRDRPVLSDHLHGRYPSVSRPGSGATVFSLEEA